MFYCCSIINYYGRFLVDILIEAKKDVLEYFYGNMVDIYDFVDTFIIPALPPKQSSMTTFNQTKAIADSYFIYVCNLNFQVLGDPDGT